MVKYAKSSINSPTSLQSGWSDCIRNKRITHFSESKPVVCSTTVWQNFYLSTCISVISGFPNNDLSICFARKSPVQRSFRLWDYLVPRCIILYRFSKQPYKGIIRPNFNKYTYFISPYLYKIVLLHHKLLCWYYIVNDTNRRLTIK